MAESPGTWVKLGDLKWQFIPHEVKEKARELDLTWEGAASLAKTFRTEKPSQLHPGIPHYHHTGFRREKTSWRHMGIPQHRHTGFR